MPESNADEFLISSVYHPWPHQIAFHQSPAKCRLQVGSYGSGKSMPLLWEGIFHALEYAGSNSVIIGKTVPDLKRTVIDTFLKYVPKEIYDHYHETDKVVYFRPVKRRRIVVDPVRGSIWKKTNDLPHCQMLVVGKDCLDRNVPLNQQCLFCRDHEIAQSKLQFAACEKEKDVNKFLSTEYVYIGFEELGQFSFTIWSALRGRNRCPIPGARPCMAGATNPFGLGWGWLRRAWVEKRAPHGMDPKKFDPSEYEFIHSTVDQNPIYMQDKEYIAGLERDPRAAQIRWGSLDVVAGQYFNNFEPGRHVRPKSDFIFQHWQPVVLGWDYGFGHWAFVAWLTKAVLKPRYETESAKIVNVFYREWYDQERTPKEQCDAIIGLMPSKQDSQTGENKFLENVDSIWLSWERFNRTTSNYTVAQEIGDLLSNVGLPRPQSSNAVDRIAGWTKMYQLFDTDDLFFVQGACPVLEEAIANVVRGDGIKTDLEDVVKPAGAVLSDDAADAGRHAIAGALLDPINKPKELQERERIAAIQDDMARAVAMYKHYNQQQAAERRGVKEVVIPTWRKRLEE